MLMTALCIWLAGCSSIPVNEPAANEAPISPQVQVPALMALPDRGTLTIKQLEDGLREFVNVAPEPLAPSLENLYAQWGVRPAPGTALVLEADLNGDGRAEVITALNDASSAGGSGTVFIIYGEPGNYLVDRVPTTVLGAGLNTVGDVGDDGRQKVVWSSTTAGANTAYATLYVASWAPGQVDNRSTYITMAFPQVAVADGDLLVSGGLGGGYGAGTQQRLRTDRYSWQGDKFVLIDQHYAPSAYAYHRLQDGMLAEQWQRFSEAAVAYREAMEPTREAALMDETIAPEWREPLAAAIRTFAEFRLDMLLGRPDRATACQTARSWAEDHPEFLQALNSPWGWANPEWTVADLCGPLPNLKGAE